MKFGRNKPHHLNTQKFEQQNSGKLFRTVTIQKIGAFITANFESHHVIVIELRILIIKSYS